MKREHHSISTEEIEGGHVVREDHIVNGQMSSSSRFVPGRAPSRDLKALIAEGPSEGKDAVGSNGFQGARRYLEGHI